MTDDPDPLRPSQIAAVWALGLAVCVWVWWKIVVWVLS